MGPNQKFSLFSKLVYLLPLCQNVVDIFVAGDVALHDNDDDDDAGVDEVLGEKIGELRIKKNNL